MAEIDARNILDRGLVAAFGLDETELVQASMELANEEIGLKDWQPSADDILAFQRVHHLETMNEETMKTENFRNNK